MQECSVPGNFPCMKNLQNNQGFAIHKKVRRTFQGMKEHHAQFWRDALCDGRPRASRYDS